MIDTSAFSQIKRIFCSYSNDRLKDYDVSFMYCPYVVELFNKNGQTMTELSRRVFMDKANTSRIINSLKAKGFIDVALSKEDRRVKLIYLNSKGEKLANHILTIKDDWQRALLNGISSQELESIKMFYQRLLDNVQKMLEKDNIKDA